MLTRYNEEPEYRHAPRYPHTLHKKRDEWGDILGAQTMIVAEIVGAVLITLSLLAMVESDTRTIR